MSKKINIAGYKLSIWTIKHAFRTEMSQTIHWSLILAVSSIVMLQISQATAAEITPVNQIFTLFM